MGLKKLNWKGMASRLAELHEKQLASAVPLWEGAFTGWTVVAVISPTNFREYDGRGLSPKEVRRFLWDIRKERCLKREHGALWARYDEERDKSYVGVGACVALSVARRADKRPTLAVVLEE